MPVPKRRISRTRGRKRRTNQKLKLRSLSKCPQCREPRLPHRACSNCGTYRGKAYAKEDQA